MQKALIRLTPIRCIPLLEVRPDSDDRCMEECTGREKDHSVKANTSCSIKNSQKDAGCSQQLVSSSYTSGHMQHNASASSANSSGRGNVAGQTHCNSAKTASIPNSGALSCPASKQKISVVSRRSSVPPDDVGDLFTPDPLTSVVKPANPALNGTIIKSSSTDACPITSSKPVSNNKVTDDLNLRKESPGTGSLRKASPLTPQSSSSSVGFELDGLNEMHVESTDGQKKTPFLLGKQMSNLDVTTRTAESDTISEASPARCFQTPPQENQADGESNPQTIEYPLDAELDQDLQFALGLDLSQSSNSSEEEVLLSLDEMMKCGTQKKETCAVSHGPPSQSKTASSSAQMCYSTFSGKKACLDLPQQPLPSVTQAGIYKNNLDQMLREKKTTERYVVKKHVVLLAVWREE